MGPETSSKTISPGDDAILSDEMTATLMSIVAGMVSKAHEVTEHRAPELYALGRNLVLKASLARPKVYVIPEDTPDAFAPFAPRRLRPADRGC